MLLFLLILSPIYYCEAFSSFGFPFHLIFPGTKWCGHLNISTSFDDLGTYKDVDMCCRTHDFCLDYIDAGETKYNLTNTDNYPYSNCACDSRLYNCLKKIDSTASRLVGYLFFNTAEVKCIKKEFPVKSCEKFFAPKSIIAMRRAPICVKYEYDETQPRSYQIFNNPLF